MKPKAPAESFILSSSPHAHADSSVSGIMLDVLIALLPALCCAVYFFGVKALLLVGTCVAACLVTESICRLAMGREQTVGDLSCVVTGLLLAFNLPPDLPLWMAVVGSVFAIAVAKQVFGGLGFNPFNPALAGRAFMLISFTGAMTTWSQSGWIASIAGSYAPTGADAATHATPIAQAMIDGVTTATPLGVIKGALSKHGVLAAQDWSNLGLLKDLFFGNINGCIGEVSAFALLVGVVYLLLRRVITWHIPVAFIGTVFLYALVLNHGHVLSVPCDLDAVPPLVHVLSGGVILGACFMATDFVTSPISWKGKLIFGVGCGVLTMLIRTAPHGAYPEGVSFSILIMNAFTPLINRWTQPKPFGKK